MEDENILSAKLRGAKRERQGCQGESAEDASLKWTSIDQSHVTVKPKESLTVVFKSSPKRVWGSVEIDWDGERHGQVLRQRGSESMAAYPPSLHLSQNLMAKVENRCTPNRLK